MDKLKWSKGLRIRLRAEGRLKVHPKMAIEAVHYLVSGSGMLKISRLLYCSIIPQPRITKSPLDESVEGIYFVLGKKSIHIEEITDPLKSSKNDIINSLMTIVFLMIVSVLSLIPETKIQIAVAGILGIVATVFTVADAALIYRKLMFNPSGPYEKRRTHEKKRRSRHSRHSHHSYHPRLSQEKDEDL
ncbi:uncharacterized protein ACOB8E_009677 [Sarcophilus harrisii]